MAANRSAMLMAAQLKKAINEPNEYVKFYMDDENPREWHILIHNFDGDANEFTGGEYLIRMVAPEKFPYEPPKFYFFTENGVYGTQKEVCINIGHYHKEEYRAGLGMDGFANQLWNGMIGWKALGGGINILNTKADEKKKLASRSREFNRSKYPELMAQIESFYADYSSKWDKNKIPIPTLIRLGLINPADAQSIEKERAEAAAKITDDAGAPTAATTASVASVTSGVSRLRLARSALTLKPKN
jgi:ubiquitin-protein ligase